MIRLGRFLYRKFSYKGFIFFIILGLLFPFAIFFYSVYSSMQNSTFVLENIYLVLASIFVIAFFIALIGYWRVSYCSYCHNPYATVPIKKEVTGKMEYRNGDLYNIKEFRLCELCGKINTKTTTERYYREED